MKRSKKKIWDKISREQFPDAYKEAHDAFLKAWSDPKRPKRVGTPADFRAENLGEVIKDDIRIAKTCREIEQAQNSQ